MEESASQPADRKKGRLNWSEVLVANRRQMEGPKRRNRKNDRIDAHKLARVGRIDPQSLFPVNHRSAAVRQDLVAVRARNALVAVRKDGSPRKRLRPLALSPMLATANVKPPAGRRAKMIARQERTRLHQRY